MFRNLSFSSYNNTKLQLTDHRILAHKHTQSVEFLDRPEVNQSNHGYSVFCSFSLYHEVQKVNQGGGSKSGACRYVNVKRRANPLYRDPSIHVFAHKGPYAQKI